jgi:hypothetical protein
MKVDLKACAAATGYQTSVTQLSAIFRMWHSESAADVVEALFSENSTPEYLASKAALWKRGPQYLWNGLGAWHRERLSHMALARVAYLDTVSHAIRMDAEQPASGQEGDQ